VAVYDAFLSYKVHDNLIVSAALHNITDRYYLDLLAQSMMPAPVRPATTAQVLNNTRDKNNILLPFADLM
jgi:outer membrane receptor for monomeric catechols